MSASRMTPWAILLTTLSLFLLAGCAKMTISGDILYRERIALPAEARVIVTLEDVSRADTPATVISQTEFEPDTQVPISFSIDYKSSDILPNHRYALRAQIRSPDNQLLWTTAEHYGVLTYNSPTDNLTLQLTRISPSTDNETSRSLAYECDQMLILMDIKANEALMYLSGEPLTLKPAEAASGARYVHPRAEFWSKADEALITVDGEQLSNCINKPEQLPWAEAKTRGIDFRASGHEPQWTLEMDADLQIEFVAHDGNFRVVTPVPVPDLDSAQKSNYHAVTDDHDLLMTIETVPCKDTISGADFPQAVKIVLDGQAFAGCGKSL